MPNKLISIRFIPIGILGGLLTPVVAIAQIIPDATLPINSTVTPQGNNLLINGGTKVGGNLFHSFEQFSISTGQIAHFNNALTIENILSRVTGTTISQIDGLIRANGRANLFLLNPNGIIFGSNAALDLGGSFFASTASSIQFAGGGRYSASNPADSVLTVSVPIGLGFGSHLGAIRVEGTGHTLIGAFSSPVIRNSRSSGLRVKPGQTLALVGGDLILAGGLLTAAGGRIALGSVGSGQVSLSFSSEGWSLGYEGVPSFRDIQLGSRALADASGVGSGSIEVRSRKLGLADGSVFLIQNQGPLSGGAMSVKASESVTVSGTDPIARISGGFRNETLGLGNGGGINISTPNLVVQAGGVIQTLTYGAAPAGKIVVEAPESLQVLGASPRDFRVVSNIASASFGAGQSGDITLSAGRMAFRGGGLVSSSTLRTGSGGDVTVKATESIELVGVEPNLLTPSAMTSSTLGSGAAGNLTLNTPRLILRDGGRIDASTGASGAAGSVAIDAPESVEVSGRVPGSVNPSLVISSANIVDESLRKNFRLPPIPTGVSGNVTIKTPLLRVTEGAQVTVRNDGRGDAGTLRIQAASIFLDGAGGITASTQSGEGGNIALTSNDIRLRHSSEISATAGGTGNGGNISIDTGTLVLLESSQIAANAFEGRGGNISILADGVFVSFPDSQITASSQLGIDGTVQINTPETNLQSALEQLKAQVITPEEIIAGSCLERRNEKRGSFVYAGTEGLPPTPQSSFSLEEPLTEIQGQPNASDVPEPSNMPLSSELAGGSLSPFSYQWKPGEPIIEGGKIVRTRDGKTLFVATPEQVAAIAPQGCSVTKTR
jgi:filamentous hemagglutinin family protein